MHTEDLIVVVNKIQPLDIVLTRDQILEIIKNADAAAGSNSYKRGYVIATSCAILKMEMRESKS